MLGENIQAYRKQAGLSQDELAQRLLVSRQTVSQWETGQTQPTVENLLRLKEIFGVSVDALLGAPDAAQPDGETEPPPLEQYTFEYTEQDMQRAAVFMQRLDAGGRTRMVVAAGLAACVFILVTGLIARLSGGSTGANMFGVFVILALIGLFVWYQSRVRQAWQKRLAVCVGMRYEYRIYGDHFWVTKYRNGELTEKKKFVFDDASAVFDEGQFYIPLIDGQALFIPKDRLWEDSRFHALAAREREKPMSAALKAVCWCLFAASLLSIPLTVWVVMTEPDAKLTSLWISVFLGLSLGSLLLGFCIFSRFRRQAKRNIIAGAVALALLLGFLLWAGVRTAAQAPAAATEASLMAEDMGIELPREYESYDYDLYGVKEVPYDFRCDVYFDGDAAQDFEEKIAADARWKTLTPELAALLPPGFDPSDADLVMVYNETRDAYNAAPEGADPCGMYCAAYYKEERRLQMVYYELAADIAGIRDER